MQHKLGIAHARNDLWGTVDLWGTAIAVTGISEHHLSSRCSAWRPRSAQPLSRRSWSPRCSRRRSPWSTPLAGAQRWGMCALPGFHATRACCGMACRECGLHPQRARGPSPPLAVPETLGAPGPVRRHAQLWGGVRRRGGVAPVRREDAHRATPNGAPLRSTTRARGRCRQPTHAPPGTPRDGHGPLHSAAN
mgnify:CR=1 FL=1